MSFCPFVLPFILLLGNLTDTRCSFSVQTFDSLGLLGNAQLLNEAIRPFPKSLSLFLQRKSEVKKMEGPKVNQTYSRFSTRLGRSTAVSLAKRYKWNWTPLLLSNISTNCPLGSWRLEIRGCWDDQIKQNFNQRTTTDNLVQLWLLVEKHQP